MRSFRWFIYYVAIRVEENYIRNELKIIINMINNIMNTNNGPYGDLFMLIQILLKRNWEVHVTNTYREVNYYTN